MDSRRAVHDFSQGWRFWLGNAHGAENPIFDDHAWEPVSLPHGWNAVDTFTGHLPYYRGEGWYRRAFHLTAEECAKKASLEFGGACASADVWINGEHAGLFVAPYAGFSVDLTGHLDPGDNVVTVRVDNTPDPDIPPGVDTTGINQYGGLYREAVLVLKDPLNIPRNGVAITTPTVSSTLATLCVGVLVRNDRPIAEEFTCTASLIGADGRLIIERRESQWLAASAERIIVFRFPGIRNPELWFTDRPYLYTLTASIEQGRMIIDAVDARMGFRSFAFSRDDGFSLNGKPLKLRGLGRHEDYPGLGNALPERLQVRDAEIIKDLGANFVRTTHTPPHPAFLDACDRLGLLVYSEIASRRYIGGERFMRNAEGMLRQMIARDKGHPCIILWGLFNEGRKRDFFARLNAAAHNSDPTRPTVYTENQIEEGRESGCVHVPDILGLSSPSASFDEIRVSLPDLKLLPAERTGDAAVRGSLEAERHQIEGLRDYLDTIAQRPYLPGGIAACLNDYGTDCESTRPIRLIGLLDAWRIPKDAYYYLKCRWHNEPMLYFSGHWTWPGQEGQPREVVVIHNCDRVELFLDGVSLGTCGGARPARWQVPYAPGVLVAKAWKDGKAGQKVLRTAGAPAQIKLVAAPGVIRADGSDAVEATIWILDANGVLVPCMGEAVVNVEGPAMARGLGGRSAAPITAGSGRILIQSRETPGEVRVRVTFEDLPSAETLFRTE